MARRHPHLPALALTLAAALAACSAPGESGDLEAFAVQSLQIYTIMYPLVGFQIVGSSYFQSSGQPFKAAVLELTRQVLFLIPLYLVVPWALHALGGSSGLMGVVISVPIADGLSVVVTAAFVAIEVRKLRAKRDAAANAQAGIGAMENGGPNGDRADALESAAAGVGQLEGAESGVEAGARTS